MEEPKSGIEKQLEKEVARLTYDRNKAEAERDDAYDTCAALLDYLRGDWHDCSHDATGADNRPGCPTCEARWDGDARIVVQAHRDRVWVARTALATERDEARAERDEARLTIEGRIKALQAERDEAVQQRDAALDACRPAARAVAESARAASEIESTAEDLEHLERVAWLVGGIALLRRLLSADPDRAVVVMRAEGWVPQLDVDRSVADATHHVARHVQERVPTADVASDLELLRRALLALQPDPGESAARWSLVRCALGHGSTVGTAICHAVGVDPDEDVRSELPEWLTELVDDDRPPSDGEVGDDE